MQTLNARRIAACLALLIGTVTACQSADENSPVQSGAALKLHPDLQWLADEKVRGIWIGGDLFAPYADTDKSKGQVLAEAGFNVVVLYTGVDRSNRDTAPGLEERV